MVTKLWLINTFSFGKLMVVHLEYNSKEKTLRKLALSRKEALCKLQFFLPMKTDIWPGR